MTYDIFYSQGVFSYYFRDTLMAHNTLFTVIFILSCALIGYLIGSINISLILSKIYGKDVRSEGSGNAGATNMTRVFGKKAGIITFLGDFLKSAISTYAGMALLGTTGAYIAGICCMVGHAFPIYFKFRGGKGVACLAALLLVMTWDVFLILILLFVILALCFRMISFASVMCAIVYPFVLYLLRTIFFEDQSVLGHVFYAFLAAVLVVFLHRKNIVRIFNHEEHKFSFGKKKDKDNEER